MTTHILAIDQGTTSSRAILFDAALRVVAVAQEEFPQIFPQAGWVEHDPSDLWSSVAGTARGVIERAGISASEIAAIGITNQRETVLIWDRDTGQPIHNAIVWQDRRTADLCQSLKDEGHEPMVTHRTGLLLDPYFSGTKVKWLLDHVEGARARAERGELLFGTVDCFLIWKLTGGRVHATDATNAARTLLYNIRTGAWDADICALLGVPMAMLPEVRDCAADFGTTRSDLFGSEIPILGVAGDQQAATVGQACFAPGMMKSTYGTGCFALLNTGATLVESRSRLLGTIAYQLGRQADLCAGRVDLHRRRRGAMAARRAEDDPRGGGDSALGRGSRSVAGRGPGACLRGPWRALLEAGLPGGDLRVEPEFRPGRACAGGLGKRGLSDPRPLGGDAGRLAGGDRRHPAGRWRHDGQRLRDAVPVGHHRCPGGPPEGARDDGPGGCLACRHARGGLP
jgi:hypothetical protein